ncbi:MAG: putative dsRNA-binding protein [Deinococcota bacterium]
MLHPKSALIERSRQLGLGKPKFDTKRTGPEHEPIFVSDALMRGDVYGTGQGSTKRDAERHASEEALLALEQRLDETLDDETLDDESLEDAAYEDAAYENTSPSLQPVPDTDFDGPWPLFPDLLVSSLQIANNRVNPVLIGQAAIDEIHTLAVSLYKASLESLGEVMEIDE